ncbi:efflux RND transporter periplasmic adaptor subunit [Umezawaea sp. Da 62-37]|uniref:efflux RND transporter periplasmic adaptor subunit n=1 Tax=Umezawaea sp. Da 62-37 TaxID=3075927 RepID=UPI0028F72A47|nr:efflux RND transporter periplasmic adaptor subunit [Umezawaea sp. Da 62-37]WNV84078.1 efflux RND transporter periplasmic adaptor subunit [Umezawaea sp. Da 62-37]
MLKQVLVRLGGIAVVVATATACGSSGPEPTNPDLVPRGTALTTAKPTRQDLTNKVSLNGKVTMNPVFGLVAPIGGQVRFMDVAVPTSTPTVATRVGSVWTDGGPTWFEVPAGATFTGRLVDDKSTVTAGMPVASAKLAGYGIAADIDSAQAYKIADGSASVQGQIKNGPGPFPCTLLGTIAALPAGTVPAPPPANTDKDADKDAEDGTGSSPTGQQQQQQQQQDTSGGTGSEPTGLRLVCTAPGDVKLINGASATLEVVTQTSANALVVPVEAVAGGQGKGKVEIVKSDGSKVIADVELGLTDGKVVEIKSGLTGDETLSMPGPNLPTAEQQQQDQQQPGVKAGS